MTTLAIHSGHLTMRSVRALIRQPWYLAVTLMQPVIWLLLFGQLFRSAIHIPGFSTSSGSYLEFLTPGVVVMTALMSSAWAGTIYIEDMNRGVMDRLLASPVSRGAMMIGTLAYQSLTCVVQTIIVFLIAFAAGARYDNWAPGVTVTVVASVLLTVIFAAMSNAVALLVRQQEALIGISQFFGLPLSFLSSAIMSISLAPDWVRQVAKYNPVNWAVEASRQALSADSDWGVVWSRTGWLIAAALGMALVATRAFGAYQKTA
jgi:ABC-2 type transport system permease protein